MTNPKYINRLLSVAKTIELIEQDKTLVIAGDQTVLEQLPDGNWIAGTIPYFMTKEGGQYSEEKLFVTDFSEFSVDTIMKIYSTDTIENIVSDSFDNGFTLIIIPALTPVWHKYALESPDWDGLYNNPIVGWVSGVKYENFATKTPKVFIGNKMFSDNAVAIHFKLPSQKIARLEIINVYEQSDDDEIYFEESGFGNNECLINGKKTNLYEYLNKKGIDETLPLVANYAGANINVGSIWNKKEKRADLFAPVFPNIPYKIAKSRNINYSQEFKLQLIKEHGSNIVFSCNCLFNFMNFKLIDKNICDVAGPITFGEIAYHVINQTFVYLIIE